MSASAGLRAMRNKWRGMQRVPPATRFWMRVVFTESCWLWMGATNGRYGTLRGGLAHRFAYEMCVGPIPAGLTLDHVASRGCTSRLCVNPAHLEAVSIRENTQRFARLRTHCKHGHEFSGENVRRTADGKRVCRACHRINVRRHLERKLAATEATCPVQ